MSMDELYIYPHAKFYLLFDIYCSLHCHIAERWNTAYLPFNCLVDLLRLVCHVSLLC